MATLTFLIVVSRTWLFRDLLSQKSSDNKNESIDEDRNLRQHIQNPIYVGQLMYGDAKNLNNSCRFNIWNILLFLSCFYILANSMVYFSFVNNMFNWMDTEKNIVDNDKTLLLDHYTGGAN